MKTKEIFNQIYEELKQEMQNNREETFVKEYEIPSMTYSENENTEDLYWASGIEMELYQMMKYFDYKVYFCSYKDKYFFSNNAEIAQERMKEEVEKEIILDKNKDREEVENSMENKKENQELKQRFEAKVNKEFKEFVEELKQNEPEVIVNTAYELVSKEEMIYKITEKDYTTSELKALLKTDGILDECYDEWLKSDGNFNEILEYAVDKRIEIILDDYEQKSNQKHRESR